MQMCDIKLAARRMGHQLVMLLQDLMEALQVYVWRLDSSTTALQGITVNTADTAIMLPGVTQSTHCARVGDFAVLSLCIHYLQGRQFFIL